jgi:thiamine-monophosphate kinase
MTRRGEFELIASLFAPLSSEASGALSLTDDAALIDVAPGCELVATIDTLIAGVHFRVDDPPDLVARKALRVNLSDLAAKGARPIGVLQAITLSEATDDPYLEAYARGLGEDLRHFGVPLLGGDTTAHRSPAAAGRGGPFTITIAALGEVPRGQAILRRGARPGELVCVSGTIGDAALGLFALEGRLPPVSPEHYDVLVGRYRLPEPRLALGLRLRGVASACVDLSDGLCADIGHICEVSGVRAELQWHALPISPAAQRRLADDPSLKQLVLGGGDDYELAFTLPIAHRSAVQGLAAQTGIPIAIVGRVRESSGHERDGVTVLGENGEPIQVEKSGYTHV